MQEPQKPGPAVDEYSLFQQQEAHRTRSKIGRCARWLAKTSCPQDCLTQLRVPLLSLPSLQPQLDQGSGDGGGLPSGSPVASQKTKQIPTVPSAHQEVPARSYAISKTMTGHQQQYIIETFNLEFSMVRHNELLKHQLCGQSPPPPRRLTSRKD